LFFSNFLIFFSGWFSDSELIFSNSAADDSSFDCFNFSDSHILTHSCKYLPGQEYKKFTQASWRCEGEILSLSVAGTISVGKKKISCFFIF